MNSRSDSIHCGICYMKYDRQQKIPLSLPQCGHTCCKECTNHILASQPVTTCPFCKKPFMVCLNGIYLQPKVNFAVLSALEDKHLFGVCELHNVPYEYLCEDDQQYVCSKCCILGEHKGHQVMELQIAKKEYDNQMQILENEKKELRGRVIQVKTLLEKREHNALKETDDFFDEIEAMIKKQKQERKAIIIQKYANEKKFFDSHLYTGRAIEHNIMKYKAVTPENLCKIKYENFLETIKKSSKQQIANNLQAYISALNEIPEKVTPFVIDNHSFQLPEIHFPSKIFPTKSQEILLTKTPSQSCLIFEIVEDIMVIKLTRTEQQSSFRNFAELKCFRKFNFQVENVYISSKDYEFLCNFLSGLSQVQSVSIEFGPEIVRSSEIAVTFRKELTNLMTAFLAKPNQISSLHLIWNSNYEGHTVVNILVDQILPTLPSFKSLEINMPNTKLDKSVFGKLVMIKNLLFSSKGIIF